MTDIVSQVKNYTGSNSFVLKMKDALSKYGSLTVNQKSAVEKIFKNVEEVKKVEFTPEMKEILCYDGPSSFVNDLKSKLNLYGKLSEKQIQAGLNQIQKENESLRALIHSQQTTLNELSTLVMKLLNGSLPHVHQEQVKMR